MARVLAVGWDAMPLHLVRAWAGSGALPNVAALLTDATIARVQHSGAFRAELPWSTFLSGRTPNQTDYWGTVDFDPETYSVVERGAADFVPFYARLGVPIAALDVPHSRPVVGVEGAQVVAWGSHSPQFVRSAWPSGCLDEIDRRFGPHPALHADGEPGWHSPPYLRSLTTALVEGARRRGEAMRWLLGTVPDWEFAITVFSEWHAAGHHLWHGIDTTHPLHKGQSASHAATMLRQVTVAMDLALGRLMGTAADLGVETVVLFAVNGMTANAADLPALHFVPELVHRLEWGWPALTQNRPDDASTVTPGPLERVGDVVGAGFHHHRHPDPSRYPSGLDRSRDLLRLASRRARRFRGAGHIPWWRVSPNATPEVTDLTTQARRLDYLGTTLYERWWPRQRAFVLPSFSDCHLRVNLRGREHNGIVHCSDYEVELDRWTAEIGALRDLSGRSVSVEFERPRRSDPLRGGGPAPDLIARFAEPLDRVFHPRAGRIGPFPYLRTSEHTGEGFLAARGVGALDVASTEEVALMDVGRAMSRMLTDRRHAGHAI